MIKKLLIASGIVGVIWHIKRRRKKQRQVVVVHVNPKRLVSRPKNYCWMV